MIAFPNAKINLGLHILRKRPDGYHDISGLFYPIPLKDVLEIIEATKLSFTSSGLPIPGNPASNLCLKAYQLINADHDIPPVAMHLHKVIPMGAGLGGGSADGAFMLKMLNEKFSLGLSVSQLEAYAARLGSDCPFFINNQPALASGRGTELSAHNLNLSGYFLALVFPGVHIGTAEAYTGVKPNDQREDPGTVLNSAVASWKNRLVNDFEASVFPKYPALQAIKDALYMAGAEYASMTGSGSTLYGLFRNRPDLSQLPSGVEVWVERL